MAMYRAGTVAVGFVYLLLTGPLAATAVRTTRISGEEANNALAKSNLDADMEQDEAIRSSEEEANAFAKTTLHTDMEQDDAIRSSEEEAKNALAAKTTLHADMEQDAQFCNPFSRQLRKSYRVEVLESGDDCTVGECTAYEFVRDTRVPSLKIHHGQSWAVKSVDGGDFEWKLVQRNAAVGAWDEVRSVYEAESIAFGEASETTNVSEFVQFNWKDGSWTWISGGIFYKEALLKRGIDEFHFIQTEGTDDAMLHNVVVDATKDVGKGGEIGVEGGLGTTGLVGSGIWLVASDLGVLALYSGTELAAIGAGFIGAGAVLGGIIGAVVGAGVGGAAIGIAAIRSRMQREEISGAEEIWKKVYCLKVKVCSRNEPGQGTRVTTIVYNQHSCPS